MMTTRKRQCKLPDVPMPKRVAYGRFLDAAYAAGMKIRKLFRKPKAKAAVTADSEPLPPPHTWPPYGGECWQQAYQEAVAMRLVADTYQALEAAKRSAYMPPAILANYIAAYNAAKVQYLAAWGAMDDCLNMIV
jgi:hypothetical protein